MLGSATFTTLERTSSVVFEEVEAGRDNVVFTFTVDKADIDYDPTGTPAVQYEVRSIDGAYYDSSWAESFVDVDDNTVRGGDSFSGLTPNTEYELEISLSTETELISLGTTTFDTFHEFKFQKNPSADVTDTTTNITISMRASYLGFVSAEETPDVLDQLYITVAKVGSSETSRYQFASISTYGKYVIVPSGTIDNLTSGTSYTLSVYYQPDNESPELLGSADFTTTGEYTGFSWESIDSTFDGADITFNISSTYLDYDSAPSETLQSLFIKVEEGAAVVDYFPLNALNLDSGDNLIGTATISGLTAGSTYRLTLVRSVDGDYQSIGSTRTFILPKVNGIISDYLVTINNSEGEMYLPVQIDYTDPDNSFGSFYVQLVPGDGTTTSDTAAADELEEYQSLVFREQAVMDYITGGGTSFTINVYKWNDQTNALWTDSVQISEANINRVYSGSIPDPTIREDAGAALGISLSYVYGVQTPNSPRIVFINEDDTSETYSYDIDFANYFNVTMTNPAATTGEQTINDFNSLASAMGNKTFTVRIDYNDGTSDQQKVIQTGVSFTFA